MAFLPRVAGKPTSVDFLPCLWHAGRVIRNVAVIAHEGVAPFELGVLCEAFGMDRSDDGLPVLDFAVCSLDAAPVRTSVGFTIAVDHDLSRVDEADLVAVPAMPHEGLPEEVLDALRRAVARGARVLSVCTGAFALGAAGLLDGRRCTTHWMHSAELAARFPAAEVVPEVLYVDDGQVVTSAGTAAGIDACLHLWRQEFGAAAAGKVARRIVVPPQRDGGQAQFIKDAVPACDAETLGPLLTWMAEHLDEDLAVERLAPRSSMSARTFARRFRDETGTTPHAWVTRQRVLRAEQLLETTDLSVDRIAAEVGFGNGATLRHHFTRVRSVSPQRYRQMFCSLETERAG
jgi:transcriptional regulator GlxA family with amidase domain